MQNYINRFKIIQLIISIFLMLSTSIAFAAGLELVYKVESIQETKEENTKPVVEKSNKTETIILLPTKFSITEGDIQDIFDFNSRRIIKVNHHDKSFEDNSLYAEVILRISEFNSQLTINKKEFEAETIFNMKAENSSKKDIVEKIDKDIHTFSYDGEVVASFITSNKPVPAQLLDSFKKYFVYKIGIHPDIRNKIIEYQKILSNLSYHTVGVMGIATTNYRLESTKNYASNDIEIPAGYTQVYSIDPELNSTIVKSQDASKILSEEQRKAEVDKLIESGRDLYSSGVILEAWKCFDQAIKIMPSHPESKKIKAQEDKIRQAHPEYF